MAKLHVEHNIVHAVDELLVERQQLLLSFCRAAGLGFGENENAATDQLTVLKRLCQVLMDYYALWQFEFHDQLLHQQSQYPKAVEELRKATGRLDESRTIAVAFNDKYDPQDHVLVLNRLEHDLSLLGEEIAQQISLEDKIIGAMGVL